MIRTSLAHIPSAPTSAEELEALRRRAWLEHGVAHLPVDEIGNELERQMVINLATRRYGRRAARGSGRGTR